MLPPKAIKEFKDIYKEEFNVELSDEEAVKMSSDLINIFKILLQSSNIVRLTELKKDTE